MRPFRQFLSNWSRVLRVIGDTDGRLDLLAPPAWRALYVAALFETDKVRMVQRVDEAKKALVVRARELFQIAGDHRQEQSAIEDALQSLHALEQCRPASVHSQALE